MRDQISRVGKCRPGNAGPENAKLKMQTGKCRTKNAGRSEKCGTNFTS